MPTPSDFEVPADRPHFASGRERLPRAVDRAGDVALVQPRGRGDALPGPGRVRLLRSRRSTYRQLRDAGRGAGRLAAEGRRQARATGSPLFMQNCPQFPVALLRHPARQRGRGAGESDEPRRGVQALHHRPRHQGRDLQRRPGGDRRRRQRGAARRRARCASVLVDALHRHDARRRRSPRPMRRRRRWTPGCAPSRRCRPAARAGPTRSPHGCVPGPHTRRARRPGAAALHVGNDRPARRAACTRIAR